jgi:hypothetical protein
VIPLSPEAKVYPGYVTSVEVAGGLFGAVSSYFRISKYLNKSRFSSYTKPRILIYPTNQM